MSEWRPINTAPLDGTVVDLWIVGFDNTVDFYAPAAKKVKNEALRHGRTAEWRWLKKPSNRPNWYPIAGLGYPLPPEVKATHWQPLPDPPIHPETGED